MSFESLNAENRNAGFAIPVRRRCSFCRGAGHNISTCNDDRLVNFENLCIDRSTTLSQIGFREWLDDYSTRNPTLVKAYAVRYCGCAIRQYMFSCINYIIVRIREINPNAEERGNREPQESITPQPQSFINMQYQSENNQSHWYEQRLGLLSATQAETLLNENRRHEPRDIETALALINLLLSQHSNYESNRKFNIQTNIVECEHTNECECSICYDCKDKNNFIKLNCGHEFCKDCIKQTLKNVRTEKPHCAFCRAEIKNMELTSQDILNEFNDVILS